MNTAQKLADRIAFASQKWAVLIAFTAVTGGVLYGQEIIKALDAQNKAIAAAEAQRAKIPPVRIEDSFSYSPNDSRSVERISVPKEIAGTARNLKCVVLLGGISCDWESAKIPTLKTAPQP